jgi:hypothetical protein
MKSIVTFIAAAGLLAAFAGPSREAGPTTVSATPHLADAEQERFLSTAKILRSKQASKGVTGTTRVTMTDGKTTHDAHVQYIDESRHEFVTDGARN